MATQTRGGGRGDEKKQRKNNSSLENARVLLESRLEEDDGEAAVSNLRRRLLAQAPRRVSGNVAQQHSGGEHAQQWRHDWQQPREYEAAEVRRAPDQKHREEGARRRVEALSRCADEGAVGEEDEDADRGDVLEVCVCVGGGGEGEKVFGEMGVRYRERG